MGTMRNVVFVIIVFIGMLSSCRVVILRVPPSYKVVILPEAQRDTSQSADTILLVEQSPDTVVIPPVTLPHKPSSMEEHYYSNGRVSLRIHPWVEGERLWELFDLHGQVTYSAQEVRKSYSVGLRADFHENGAVKALHEHMNPGASMYMYNATMTFDSINQPLWKHVTRTPSYGINERFPGGGYFYWCKQQKTWRPKEVVRETH